MLPYLDLFGAKVPMYGLCMAVAMLLAVGLSCLRAKKRGADVDRLLTIALAAIVCGIIGAKLLYFIVTYSWDEIVSGLRANGFSFIINGGLVFYGGLIGGVLGAFLGAKLVRVKLSNYSDAVVPTLPLAHAIGRLGCFCSGCCYGRATDSWIGMCFPNSITGLAPDVRVIPTQLIESGLNLILFVALVLFTLKRRRGFTTLFVYLIAYGVERFLLEFLRGDEIRGIFGLFSTSQWISIGLMLLGAAGLIITHAAKKRAPADPAPDPKSDAGAGEG